MTNKQIKHTPKLTRAERQAIIDDYAKGIQHPYYYVYQSSNGITQVRKRKNMLTGLSTNDSTLDVVPGAPDTETKENIKEEPPTTHNNNSQTDYDSITNKQLLERMLNILEKNTYNVVGDTIEKEQKINENEAVNNHVEQVIKNEEQLTESQQPPTPSPQQETNPKGVFERSERRLYRRGRIL